MSATSLGTSDPLTGILARSRSDATWWGFMVGAALFAHAALASALPRGAVRNSPSHAPVQLMDVDPAPPPPPANAPTEAPRPPSAGTSPAPRATRKAFGRTAQSWRSSPFPLVTQPETPDDPATVVDLTDSVVEGSGSIAAGGAGPADGKATPNPGPARVPLRARPNPPRDRSADLSRKPVLAGGAEWACPFPPEADRAGIDSAVVWIRVAIDASGAVRDVDVQSDPGHGFGRAAQQCARTRRWMPALDGLGKAADGDVVIRVRFARE